MPQRSSLGDGPVLRYRCVLSCDPDHAARLSSNCGQSEDRRRFYGRRDIKSGSSIRVAPLAGIQMQRGPFQDARAPPTTQMDTQASPLRESLRASIEIFIYIKNHPQLHHGIIVIYIEATSTILIYITPVARRIQYCDNLLNERKPASSRRQGTGETSFRSPEPKKPVPTPETKQWS